MMASSVAGQVSWASIKMKLVVNPLPRMLKDGSRMVQTLMISQLGRRSVLPDSPKKERLMSSLQEMELQLRGRRMYLHGGRNK
ncbi:hypothetical protein L3X38_010566 [Prunus dulcis]|uniref:Uncharacterized protein n=1 Tax=Prunus dulcis TaxID=3755 RepID=A0AAD4WFV8_PRUDU|nr:hypothetical protein L3X38_010566 [Prunus dulcis]